MGEGKEEGRREGEREGEEGEGELCHRVEQSRRSRREGEREGNGRGGKEETYADR